MTAVRAWVTRDRADHAFNVMVWSREPRFSKGQWHDSPGEHQPASIDFGPLLGERRGKDAIVEVEIRTVDDTPDLMSIRDSLLQEIAPGYEGWQQERVDAAFADVIAKATAPDDECPGCWSPNFDVGIVAGRHEPGCPAEHTPPLAAASSRPWRTTRSKKPKHASCVFIQSASGTIIGKLYGHEGQPFEINAELLLAAVNAYDVRRQRCRVERSDGSHRGDPVRCSLTLGHDGECDFGTSVTDALRSVFGLLRPLIEHAKAGAVPTIGVRDFAQLAYDEAVLRNAGLIE